MHLPSIVRLAAPGILVFLSAACSSTCPADNDPRSGGLVGGVCGVSSSGPADYDARLKAREERLAAVKGETAPKQERQQELTQQSEAQAAEVAALRGEAQQLQRETKALQKTVDGKTGQSAAYRTEAANLRAETAKINQEISQIQAGGGDAALLREKVAQLERVRQRLIALSRL